MFRWQARLAAVTALALVAGAVGAAIFAGPAQAASAFPSIRSWVLVGAYQDSTTLPNGDKFCLGYWGPRPDSVRVQPRALSLRWLRDREAEKRPDFGGYRIYRMINTPDTSAAVLLRRYSLNDLRTWHFTKLDTATMSYNCGGRIASDSILTYVDPDSSGDFIKICKKPGIPGQCTSRGDSIWYLQAPPGPHDGFRTYYTITYEALNGTDATYSDLFVADTVNAFSRCDTTGLGFAVANLANPDPIVAAQAQVAMIHVRNSCPNLNDKARNIVGPFSPTGGPAANLESVHVVPNPYRGSAVWDGANANEIHFINLPAHATIKIYTVSGDLVRELQHSDTVHDYEIWDLKSGAGRTVASGIYLYRIEAASFSFQNRFVVIR